MTKNKEQFFNSLQAHLTPSELTKVQVAYTLAKFGHRFQLRKEIEDNKQVRYFEHVKRVALVLIDELNIYNCDDICIALLHDSFEDTKDITPELVEFIFGNNVCKGVKYLTNIPKEGYVERLNLAPNNIKIIKLCDRVDNMRHINSELCTEKFQIKKKKETVSDYIPMFLNLSHNLKCEKLIQELQNICNV